MDPESFYIVFLCHFVTSQYNITEVLCYADVFPGLPILYTDSFSFIIDIDIRRLLLYLSGFKIRVLRV
jgi:hypothetical protein